MGVKELFSKISPLEYVIMGAELISAYKATQGDKKIGEKLETIRQEFKKGNLKQVEKILSQEDYKGFIDENRYSDAVDQLPNEKSKHLDEMMRKLAKDGTTQEQTLARRAIEAVATNPDPKRRKELVEKMAACKNTDELINFFYARGWDRPDDPMVNIITQLIEYFAANIAPTVGKYVKKGGKRIKEQVRRANQKTEENLRKSGFVAWTEKVLEKAKK